MGASAVRLHAAVPPWASWSDYALARIGAALDRAALTGMRLAFAEALHPSADVLARLEASALPYLDPTLQRAPRRFFEFLDAPAAPRMRSRGERRLGDGVAVERAFVSAYRPWNPRAAWLRCDENARIPIEHWMHRPRGRATIIALHGFTMGLPAVDARVLMAPQWFARGYDVVLLTLPFHGPRAPATSRYSGQHFASWDVGCLNESVRQAVHDIDIVRRWLVAEGAGPVVIMGLSLGGYLAALLAGLCPDLAFVIPVAAPVDLADLPRALWSLGEGPRTPPPISPATLAAAYRVHSPLSFPLAISRRRACIVGGRGDCVVPPAHADTLWRHWDQPPLHWFSGGHTTPFGRTRIVERLDAHLRAVL